jgi:hypothetical protein
MGMKYTVALLFLLAAGDIRAQVPDFVFSPSIGTPQLFVAGDQAAYPILRMNSPDQLELHFDDLDGVKNYYYTVVLCNEDWTPAQVSEFDYIKGFSQIRIDNYTLSSVALTHYVHYQAVVPDPNCRLVHSGNYLLKVYLDGDTSKLAFTKRFLVVDSRVPIQSQLRTPQNPELSHTGQNIQFILNTGQINPANPLDQVKVDVLQNYRWDNVIRQLKPTFAVNNRLEYTNPDDINFEGGYEWRWIDLESFRFQSARVESVNYGKTATDIVAKPDAELSHREYYFIQDYNGKFLVRMTESYNPLYQADYATVHFSFVPPGGAAFPERDVYLLGRFTGGGLNDSTRMVFDPGTGRYERSFFMKMGYYSYSYVTVDRNDPSMKPSFALTEGNHVETENDYMILVYYRALGARADELVGMTRFNSLNR